MLDQLQQALEARGAWCYRRRFDPDHDELWTVIDGQAKVIKAVPSGLIIASGDLCPESEDK